MASDESEVVCFAPLHTPYTKVNTEGGSIATRPDGI
jgi:hypothetical protein